MKAKLILDAILAMKDMEDVTYTTEPEVWAGKLNRLATARIELQIELGMLNVEVGKKLVAWLEHHKGGDNLNWERVDHPYAKATPLYSIESEDGQVKETAL